jgi:hypothetical protein
MNLTHDDCSSSLTERNPDFITYINRPDTST